MISLAALSAALCIVFAAGVLRGLTGFGFALLAVIGLGQFWPPTLTTPLVLLLELALTALLLKRSIVADADIDRLKPLLLGGLVGVVAGTALVSALPPAVAKLALEGAVLASAVVSLLRPRGAWIATKAAAIGVGALFGTLAGAFAVGGPFVVVWFLGLGLSPAIVRSNLILTFGLTDALALAARLPSGDIDAAVLSTALMLLPAALFGAFLGERWFKRVDPALWRRIAATVIAGGALVSLARSLYALLVA